MYCGDLRQVKLFHLCHIMSKFGIVSFINSRETNHTLICTNMSRQEGGRSAISSCLMSCQNLVSLVLSIQGGSYINMYEHVEAVGRTLVSLSWVFFKVHQK